MLLLRDLDLISQEMLSRAVKFTWPSSRVMDRIGLLYANSVGIKLRYNVRMRNRTDMAVHL